MVRSAVVGQLTHEYFMRWLEVLPDEGEDTSLRRSGPTAMQRAAPVCRAGVWRLSDDSFEHQARADQQHRRAGDPVDQSGRRRSGPQQPQGHRAEC